MENVDNLVKKRKRKKNSLSISGISQKVEAEFKQYAKDNHLEQHKLQTMMWDNFNNLYVVFSEKEQGVINEARQLCDTIFKKAVKNSILRNAQKVIEMTHNPANTNVDETVKNSAKSADIRVARIVEEMIEGNKQAANWYDKVFINKKSILKNAQERKKQNPESYGVGNIVIDRYIDRNKEFIQNHNNQEGLNENHNLKAYHQKNKIKKQEARGQNDA